MTDPYAESAQEIQDGVECTLQQFLDDVVHGWETLA